MDNKKKLYIILGLVLIIIAGIAIWFFGFKESDALKFKEEYEILNGEKTSSGNKYQTLSISKDNKVEYLTIEKAIETLEKGTGLIYFGANWCPWCRGVVPVLLDAVDCSCLEKVYYVDSNDIRDTYEIKDGKPVETKKATPEYKKLLELLDEYLEEYILKDEDGKEISAGEKRLYIPLVVAVKNGEIVSAHTDSVPLDEGQSPYDELTKAQKQDLKDIFTNMIDLITKEQNACEEHC